MLHLHERDDGFQIPSGAPLRGVAAAMLAFASASVALRLWTRGVMMKSLGFDDLAMFITLVREPAAVNFAFKILT